MLASLPRNHLESLGIVINISIAEREAHHPVGGCIALFVNNWDRIFQDPWVRETVTGHRHRLELAGMEPAKVHLLSKEVEDLMTEGDFFPLQKRQRWIHQPALSHPKVARGSRS